MQSPPPVAACYATFAADMLTIGNSLIERTWHARDGRLYGATFDDKRTGRRWLRAPAEQASLVPPDATTADAALPFTAAVDTSSPVAEPSLKVTLTGREVEYRFRVYPAAAGVELQIVTRASPSPAAASRDSASATSAPTGVEQDTPAPAAPTRAPLTDVVEHLVIDPLHVRLTEVRLVDQTDGHDNLVHERSWLLGPAEHRVDCVGDVFALEDSIDGEGLVLLKLAPLPHARPVKNDVDLRVTNAGEVTLLGHGIGDGGDGEGYPAVALSYTGGRLGRIRALQVYQRQLRRYEPGRDARFLSNTWGDRSRDARINEAFVAQEIDAGRALGVDVVQVDDGWQRGTTSNSVNRDQGGVWTGFWAADPNFWDHHPQRFPTGMRATTDRAAAAGLKMGLWFAPDSSNDFANWQRDADAVLRMHREFGADYVKIDGVKAHTKTAERNLRRFFDAVLDASAGRVVFDLDVTAETRPGYFGMPHVGPIFVENRYTDWHRYWPHRTLRNLWMLAHYVDPLRLRMEFLNNARHADQYADDPLAPSTYRADYLFATVMFANPLGWFETSNLPPAYGQQVAPLVEVWKQHRDAIFGGTIVPIGDEPDGTRWTGFASVAADESGAIVLVFREFTTRGSWCVPCDQLGCRPGDVRVLAGDGEARVDADGVTVKIPEPRRFALLHVTAT